MVVAITGANGFIGAALCSTLSSKGHDVIALVRDQHAAMNVQHSRKFDLRIKNDPGILTGVDILIHCAFADFSKNLDAPELNFSGTSALVEQARKSGVKKIIFFSSVAAHPAALSEYGKSKLRLEKLFNDGDVVIRCGLVLGKKGLFGRILKQALTRKFIPLVNGGKTIVQVIAVDDVLTAVENIIELDLTGGFVLANGEKFTFKDLFKKIASTWQTRFYFLPLPGSALPALVKIAGLLKITIPISRENILGLLAMRYTYPDESIRQLSIVPKTAAEKLKTMHEDVSVE